MSDDLIKNPNRSLPRQTQNEPEYVRLKKEPTPMVSSIDSMVIDDNGDVAKLPNNQFIDNNDYVDIDYGNVLPSNLLKDKTTISQTQHMEEELSPQVGDYILMVFGKIVISGSLKDIENRVRKIMYGDDDSFTGAPIKTDDIVILKRLAIKIGIFIDE
jgi:hypothetical protein